MVSGVHFGWFDLVYIIPSLIAGIALGLFLSRFFLKSYLAKNPPINEDMVRAMMTQMGRKPSEKQVRNVMRSMQPDANATKKAKTKKK